LDINIQYCKWQQQLYIGSPTHTEAKGYSTLKLKLSPYSHPHVVSYLD